ncbi:methylmalonyl-CoA mutase [Elusimicrobiota bacterium]
MDDEKYFYTPDDLADFNYAGESGDPGEFPFTRGIHPSMYRGKCWTMRQYAGYGTAEDTNKRYLYLLSEGQTGLSVAFDLPTQIGLTSNHPLAKCEIGKVGVAIDTLHDMEILFKGIDLSKVSCSMTINSTAAILLAMYVALAEKQNIPVKELRGTIQNDILKEYLVRGTYIFPPQPSMTLVVDTLNFCQRNLPKWNPISISGYHIREAGSTAVQEVAFTLANAIAYIEAAKDAGLDLTGICRRVSFFFNAHNNFFEEIAKFRAARKCWAKILSDRFSITDDKAKRLRFHTQTGGSTLTAQQPENNSVRVALQALSSALGGTQSLHTNSKDEALALPSEEAVKLALRTQQIIAEESGISEVADPLGGSYYVESLTKSIKEGVFQYIEKIDKNGGMLRSIEDGFIQKEIYSSSYEYQKKIEDGTQVLVGVNKYADESEEVSRKINLHKLDPDIEKRQLNKLNKTLEERDSSAVQSNLRGIHDAAKKGKGITEAILMAVRSYATIGEICEELKSVWGEYQSGGIF